eukprot:scaffold20276_cov224-Skeletonema_marinoi.AAC.21
MKAQLFASAALRLLSAIPIPCTLSPKPQTDDNTRPTNTPPTLHLASTIDSPSPPNILLRGYKLKS